ncbi:MAG: hypothetical protein GY718_10495 [Lentisphaerae bacterium]|nr:hypothetical protein [Lentisphaerota bacterium]
MFYNVCIGNNAGADLTTEENVIIIGDNIRDLTPGQEGVLFIGDKIAIGETVMGKPVNLDFAWFKGCFRRFF